MGITNSVDSTNNQVLHFNKWSHKSYAIFNSIGRVVHIGFLSTILPGLITVKSLISHGQLSLLFELCGNDDLEEELKELSEKWISGESDIFSHLNISISNSKDNFDQNYTFNIYFINCIKTLYGSFFVLANSLYKSSIRLLFVMYLC
jgi:hypothetical protein